MERRVNELEASNRVMDRAFADYQRHTDKKLDDLREALKEQNADLVKKIDGLNTVVSRLAWLIVTAVAVALLQRVILSGGLPGG
jgi:predicted NBD/HSP70 family sugar kinase